MHGWGITLFLCMSFSCIKSTNRVEWSGETICFRHIKKIQKFSTPMYDESMLSRHFLSLFYVTNKKICNKFRLKCKFMSIFRYLQKCRKQTSDYSEIFHNMYRILNCSCFNVLINRQGSKDCQLFFYLILNSPAKNISKVRREFKKYLLVWI